MQGYRIVFKCSTNAKKGRALIKYTKIMEWIKNNWSKVLVYGLAILFLFLWLKGCGHSEPTKQKVTIPEQKGIFEPQEPKYITKTDTVYITRWKEREVKTENPINKDLAEAYQNLEDSLNDKESELERWKMFVDAIQIRQFKNTFEDSLIKIDVFGEVQGKLNKIATNYTIKEREYEYETKQTVFRLLAGAEVGNNINFNDFTYKLNLGFQNKKGNIFMGGYSFMNDTHYIFAEYDFEIFSVKN